MKIKLNPHYQLAHKNSIAGNYKKLPAIKNPIKEQPIKNTSIPSLKAYFGINFKARSLNYDPIVKVSPTYRLIYNDCDSIYDFAEKFTSKLNSQLMNPDIRDVNKLINDIKLETGADDKLILETLFRMTQFSSYKSINAVEKTANKLSLYAPPSIPSSLFNYAMKYICWKKFNIGEEYCHNFSIFADNNWLKTLEAACSSSTDKTSIENQIEKINELFKINRAKLCILDGFDIKASDNNNYSANFLSGTGYLKSLAIDTIKRIQNGESPDDIFNKDIIQRICKIFPKAKENIVIIKPEKPEEITPETILDNLTSLAPKKEYIKDLILRLSEITPPNDKSGLNVRGRQKAIMKYLDNFTFVFSPESMSTALRKMKWELEILENRTRKKNLFYIPYDYKSNVLINYMYSKVNNIENLPVIFKEKEVNPAYNTVILDDMSISGQSYEQIRNNLAISMNVNDYINSHFYFYSIISANAKAFRISPNCISETLHITQVDPRQYHNTFTPEECMYLNNFASLYKNSMTAIAFPYIIPDNNSYIGSYAFTPILYKNTIFSNKGLRSANWKPLNQ